MLPRIVAISLALLAWCAPARSQHPIGPQCTAMAADFGQPDVGIACEAVIEDKRTSKDDRVDALLRRGVWHYRAGRRSDAKKDIDRALALAPDNPKLLQLRAALHLDDGNLEEARLLANKSAALDPTRAYTFEVLGSVSWQMGDYRAAIGYYSRVIEMSPYHAFARYNRARLFLDSSRAPEALSDTTWLLAQTPADNNRAGFVIMGGEPVRFHVASLLLHAETLRETDRFEEAETQFAELIKYERSAVTLTRRSQFLHGLPIGAGMESRLAEAMRDAKEAVQLDWRNLRAHKQYASTLEYAKRHQEALLEIDVALKLADVPVELVLHREWQPQRWPSVLSKEEYARELPPLFWARARLLRAQGQTQEAIQSALASVQLAELVDPSHLQQRVRRLISRGYLQTQGSRDDWSDALINAVTACMVDEACW